MNVIENYMVVPVATSFFSESDGIYDWLRNLKLLFVIDNARNCFVIFNINRQLRKELFERFQPRTFEFHTYPTPPERYIKLFRRIGEKLYENILEYCDRLYPEPATHFTYSQMQEVLHEAFFESRESDLREILLAGLQGIIYNNPCSHKRFLCEDVPVDDKESGYTQIKNYAIFPYDFNIDVFLQDAYWNLAYAVDKERKCLIVFNPGISGFEKFYDPGYPITGIYSVGEPPKCYKPLFDYVNDQMERNLAELNTPRKQRWMAYAKSDDASRISQTRHLHGIDSETFNPLTFKV